MPVVRLFSLFRSTAIVGIRWRHLRSSFDRKYSQARRVPLDRPLRLLLFLKFSDSDCSFYSRQTTGFEESPGPLAIVTCFFLENYGLLRLWSDDHTLPPSSLSAITVYRQGVSTSSLTAELHCNTSRPLARFCL